jgi:hypothetical protein
LKASATLAVSALIVLLAVSSTFAQYEPFAVEIDPQDISFHIDGPPGIYDADLPVNVSVSSGFSEWTLHCQASTLAGLLKGGAIPPSRLYLEGVLDDLAVGDESLVSLDKPVLVAQGTFTGPEFVPVNVLRFRIRSEWEDKPGTYSGQITFTYLAVP